MTTHEPRKPLVAVVFGGRSSEHAVSCATAAGVLSAIDRERYDVVPIGVSRDGSWVLVDDDPGLNHALADLLAERVHALAIVARAPGEPA